MKTYITRELCNKFNMPRERLYQLRKGCNHGHWQNGKNYKYFTKPILIFGIDWGIDPTKGIVLFFESAIAKIKETRK